MLVDSWAVMMTSGWVSTTAESLVGMMADPKDNAMVDSLAAHWVVLWAEMMVVLMVVAMVV